MNNNVVLGASAVAVGLAVLMCMKKGDAVEDVNRRPKVAEDSTDDEAPVAKQAPTQVAEATPTPPAPTPAPTPAPAAAAPAKPEGAFAEGQFLAANQGARADVRGLVGKFVEMKGSRANVRFEDGKARSLNPDQLDVIDEATYNAALAKRAADEAEEAKQEQEEALRRAEEAARGL